VLILGLSSAFKSHATAAVARDGVIEAAIENYKLDPAAPCGIPEAAIEYCLSRSETSWSGVDVVAIASDPIRGWGRRAFSRRGFSPLAPLATCYQQGKELRRLARELTDLRILRHRLRRSQSRQYRSSLLPCGQRLLPLAVRQGIDSHSRWRG